MNEEAIIEMRKAVELSRGSAYTRIALASGYAYAGRKREAVKLLEGLESPSERGFVPIGQFSYVYAALGDRDRALHYLERAYEDRLDIIALLGVSPKFDPLRSDPRFQDLLHRVGLQSKDNLAK